MAIQQIVLDGIVVEEEVTFTLAELSRACAGRRELLSALVDEGALSPRGRGPDDWVFDGASLRTARVALRLIGDLDLSPAGVALVLDLLARIRNLREC